MRRGAVVHVAGQAHRADGAFHVKCVAEAAVRAQPASGVAADGDRGDLVVRVEDWVVHVRVERHVERAGNGDRAEVTLKAGAIRVRRHDLAAGHVAAYAHAADVAASHEPASLD